MAEPSPSPPASPSFLAHALAIARKDLQIEWKSREIVYTMTFLAALVVLVFAFAFTGGAETSTFSPDIISGILWVAVLFSGTVGLSRTFDRERDGEAIRSLLLSPVPRAAIFVGKLTATVLLMLFVEAVVSLLCAVFFSADVANHAASLALVLFLGSLGFAAVGTVFSAALLRARSRDVLLSTLLYPVVVPVFMAGAKGTSQLLDPLLPDLKGAVFWTEFLLGTDILLLVIGVWAFEPIVTGE